MGNKILRTFYKIINSRKFFYVVIGLFFLQASWFALTVQYPMAFDENYHFGIIQFYSHQWLPFMSQQPQGSEAFGDLIRYDSYMFHYLMSFPYRLIAAFVSDQVTQIIILRFINIALFIGGIFLFRNLLRRLNVSDALIHFLFLILVFIPIVPFLAATINYDNLAFLVMPLFVALAIRCSEALRNGKLPANIAVSFFAVGAFGSLVKYAFAPIFLAAIAYLAIVWIRSDSRQKILKNMKHSFLRDSFFAKLLLIIVAITSIGLLAERYGTNFLQYHRYEPSCEKIRPISECIQYGPWGRDYKIKAMVDMTNPPHDPAIPLFLPVWVGNYMYRLYFAINHNYAAYDPLPIPYYAAYVIGLFGFILCLLFWKTIFKANRHMMLLALIMAAYVISLLYVNFTGFLKGHTITAANGRYLILIMPLLFAMLGIAYRAFFVRIFKHRAHTALVIFSSVTLVLALNGGGAETHLLRMDQSGYWQNTPAPTINTTLKNILAPTVIGS